MSDLYDLINDNESSIFDLEKTFSEDYIEYDYEEDNLERADRLARGKKFLEDE